MPTPGEHPRPSPLSAFGFTLNRARNTLERAAGIKEQARDAWLRLRLSVQEPERQRAMLARLKVPAWQARMIEGFDNLLSDFDGEKLPTLIKERGMAVQQLKEMLTIEDTKIFHPEGAAAGVHEQIILCGDAIETLRLKPGDGGYDLLKRTQAFLRQIQDRIGADRTALQRLAAEAQPNLTPHQRELDTKLKNAGRILTILGAGAMTLLTAGVAIMANPSSPNLNATLLWAIPTVIALYGPSRLLGSSWAKLAIELHPMALAPFTDFAASHPKILFEPMNKLFENRSEAMRQLDTLRHSKAAAEEQAEAKLWLLETMDKDVANRYAGRRGDVLKHLTTLRDGTKTPEQKAEAERELRAIMGGETTAEIIMEKEDAFHAFAYPLLRHVKSDEAVGTVLRYLRDARVPK